MTATVVAVGIENSIEESAGVNEFFDFFQKYFWGGFLHTPADLSGFQHDHLPDECT